MITESPTASGLRNVEICPGFVQDKDDKNVEARDAGILQHKAAETGNLEGLTGDQKEAVGKCLSYVAKYDPSLGDDDKEVRVRVPGLDRNAVIDRRLRHSAISYLFDYKFGRNSVDDAEINNQGQAYALAEFTDRPDVQVVEVVFLSPYLDEVSKFRFGREDMGRLRLRIDTIRERQAAVAAGDLSLLKVTDGCRYCGNRGVCPAMFALVLPVAQGYSDTKFTIPENMHPSTWTKPEQFALALDLWDVLKTWGSSVTAHTDKFRQEQACDIPGRVEKTRTAAAAVKDMLALWNTLQDRVSVEEFVSCCDVSLAKVVDVLKAKAPKGEKGKQKDKLYDELTDKGILEEGRTSTYLQKVKEEK